ncbi:MAG: tetratricopeptide repeat protein, partial [Nitriliruptorales bacterium]|nr:tetratricopeptide repeat protein [Nitriliruptorales bacterium]
MTENFDLDRLVEAALAEPEEFLARFGQIADTLDDWQAGWVRGLALRETGRLREAEAAMGQAVDAILEIDPVAAARVRSSRSILFLSLGDTDAALADADWAAQHLIDGDAGRNESQRGIILFRLGRHLEGLDACARALPLLEQAGDLKALGRLHGNIGVTHSVLGNVESAREHLAEAARLARETDSPLAAGIAEHNLGFLEGRAGDVPAALAHFDAAEELLRDLVGPGRKAVATIDRAEVLADAGLLEDALAHVEQSIAALSEAEERIVLAEARLL